MTSKTLRFIFDLRSSSEAMVGSEKKGKKEMLKLEYLENE